MNKFAMAISLAAGLALQATAQAGTNAATSVYVGSGWAYGALTDARFSSNTTEYIGCVHSSTKSAASGTALSINFISCSATTAAGKVYSCYTYTPPQAWVDAVNGLNNASYLYFWANSSGSCMSIFTTHGSSYL